MALNCKLGLSTCNKALDEEFFSNCAKAGVGGIEISHTLKDYETMDFDMLYNLSKKYGVELWSFHLPFAPFDLIDLSKPSLAEQTIEIYKGLITKANGVGIKVFTVHPSGEPVEDDERQARIQCSKNSLDKLCKWASKLGCIIAVENVPRSCLGNCSKEILEIISGNEDLRVCFDTNHLLVENVVDFIRNVGKKIITTHISDYDFMNERHWLPGEGGLDWNAIVDAFEEVGYNGYWLYEIDFKTPWSMNRTRELTCEDFANNFIEATSKKPFTKLGEPKKRLGMWTIEE